MSTNVAMLWQRHASLYSATSDAELGEKDAHSAYMRSYRDAPRSASAASSGVPGRSPAQS